MKLLLFTFWIFKARKNRYSSETPLSQFCFWKNTEACTIYWSHFLQIFWLPNKMWIFHGLFISKFNFTTTVTFSTLWKGDNYLEHTLSITYFCINASNFKKPMLEQFLWKNPEQARTTQKQRLQVWINTKFLGQNFSKVTFCC